jgi:octaprenyl-diphosphate synthase
MNTMTAIAPAPSSVSRTVAESLARVETRFDNQLNSQIEPVATLCAHVERYRGKMLRPTLVIVTALATDKSAKINDAHITSAAVVEMIHMATLVHDDVLDEADTRRQGATINHMHGNEAAVILGDYLISQSFHLCSQLDSQKTALRVGEITSTVCEGELLQLFNRGDLSLTEETYYQIISRKTAALIAVACELGAHHAGATEEQSRAMYRFGDKLGCAFQIQDDLLDLVGAESVVGKTLGRDLEKGKLTLPLIHHLAALPADERERREAHLRVAPSDEPARKTIAIELDRTASIQYARDTASRLVAEAKQELAAMPTSDARDYLASLADAVVHRAF